MPLKSIFLHEIDLGLVLQLKMTIFIKQFNDLWFLDTQKNVTLFFHSAKKLQYLSKHDCKIRNLIAIFIH